ncbi:hypothetical protein [Psychroserpens sp. NJDZ02]|uniref:hypothetical protein n=1 Tax=Psychroserpens sp. NJDZ02 TaxID=2570561 RepID=UPI0010A8FC40|nr:hypothetical protein [Psychroserpens sp. NJDZ02]QCE41376.1 hypothetical protein E9099_08100 [Psychroserpens sp. NJDZ02]
MTEKEEIKFNTKDKRKLKNKILGKGIFTFLFLLLSAFSIYYFFKISADNYLILFIVSLIFLGTLTHIIYLFITLKKDLDNNTKIVSTVKIISMKEKRNDGISDYHILLSGNYEYNNYKVFKKDFDRINSGDTIELEYSKYGKWILKIKCNGINIENNANFK